MDIVSIIGICLVVVVIILSVAEMRKLTEKVNGPKMEEAEAKAMIRGFMIRMTVLVVLMVIFGAMALL